MPISAGHPCGNKGCPAVIPRGKRFCPIFVGSGNGLFGRYNALPNVFDDLFQGSTLEFLAFTQAKAFQAAAALSGLPVMSYDAVGTHSWGYWQDMVWNAKSRGFFR